MSNYNTEQVINGLINYADNEVMTKLPTSGKWIVGTFIGVASQRTENIIDALSDNAIVTMLGIIDEDGNIDVDALMDALKNSADKYGKLVFDVPMIGTLSFSSNDVERLRTYIR